MADLTSEVRLALLLIVVALSGCGDLTDEQSRLAARKCTDIGAIPQRAWGVNGKYDVMCQEVKP